MPLTFIVSKFIKSLWFKVVTFTFFSGALGVIVFKLIYDSRLIEEFNLNMATSMIIFSIVDLLYALVEDAVKQNIKFV